MSAPTQNGTLSPLRSQLPLQRQSLDPLVQHSDAQLGYHNTNPNRELVVNFQNIDNTTGAVPGQTNGFKPIRAPLSDISCPSSTTALSSELMRAIVAVPFSCSGIEASSVTVHVDNMHPVNIVDKHVQAHVKLSTFGACGSLAQLVEVSRGAQRVHVQLVQLLGGRLRSGHLMTSAHCTGI